MTNGQRRTAKIQELIAETREHLTSDGTPADAKDIEMLDALVPVLSESRGWAMTTMLMGRIIGEMPDLLPLLLGALSLFGGMPVHHVDLSQQPHADALSKAEMN